MKTVKLFTALLLAMVCISLSSCSKDKDNDESDNVDSGLVGRWAYFHKTNSGEEWFVFKADGTGTSWDVWEGKNSSKDAFTYVFNEKTSVLTFIFEGDEDKPDSANVVLLTDDKLILDWDGETLTYNRQ